MSKTADRKNLVDKFGDIEWQSSHYVGSGFESFDNYLSDEAIDKCVEIAEAYAQDRIGNIPIEIRKGMQNTWARVENGKVIIEPINQ